MRISYWSSDVCSSDLEAVCKSVKFGVIVYNRNVCRLTPDSLAILADRCPNLIGFKDGIGDIELMSSIHLKLGERFSYLGGLPTAEIYAAAYKRSEEHTSELQSLMRISYAVFCLKKKQLHIPIFYGVHVE